MAALLGLLEVWGTFGNGYFAGWGDHFVLSPEGISWASPGAFANDWFMEVAPQPHWFFDVLTFLGESLGILSLVYALFWACGLIAFGAATAILARKFVARAAWPAALGVTVLTGISPWAIGGTGSLVIAQALPAVLSGSLIYLLLAGMLAERRILIVILAPVIAVVHVQQGSIALVLMLSMLVVEGVRNRKVDWLVALAMGLTAAFVAFGLLIRPVASNLQDFVRICDEIIPYHCAAHLWSPFELVSTVGLVGLAVLSVFIVPKPSRWIWYATVGLATLGYAGGFFADALRIPLLGTLAQGVNVYRLGAVLLPFAIWGALVPLLTRLRGWRHWLLVGVWGVSWIAFLTAPGFSTVRTHRLVLMGLALLIPVLWFMWHTRRGELEVSVGGRKIYAASGVAAVVASILVISVTAAAGAIHVRVPDFSFVASAELRQWGSEVRNAVPEGEIIVAPPRFEWVKLVSQRAVIADCKDVPYGGTAWDEWQTRLDDLGGFEQCVAPGPLLYDTLSATQLVKIADKYESDSIIVNPALPQLIDDLESLGWTHAVGLVGTAGADLMRRP
ncbi:DUF6798 domain-containing protein [Microbacterium sp. F51-2R]|uniref:DUF6798 domain-containing protein n=1 Tax=Microbacterium sp. F51-2R TaxID=3445777 RepID=UPI003F9FE8FB